MSEPTPDRDEVPTRGRSDAPVDRGRDEPTEFGPFPAIARSRIGKLVLAAGVVLIVAALAIGADSVAVRVAFAVVLLPLLVYLTVTSNRDRRDDEDRRRYMQRHGHWPADDAG